MLVIEPMRDFAELAKLAAATRSSPGSAFIATAAGNDNRTILVAREVQSRDILGFAVAEKEDLDAHLLAIAVYRGRRRQGVGGALLRGVQDAMSCQGALSLDLDVRADDLRTQQFYTRFGFAPAGRYEHLYPDGTDAVHMQRPL